MDLVLIGLIVAAVLAALAVIQSEGKGLTAWAVLVLAGVLLYARL